jgi:hypothetical protein
LIKCEIVTGYLLTGPGSRAQVAGVSE